MRYHHHHHHHHQHQRSQWTVLPLATLLLVAAMVGGARGQLSQEAKDAIDARLTVMENTLYTTARQMMLQRLAFEENMRSEGDSGVKQVRVFRDGTRAFHTATHTSRSAAVIHDHSELTRTCGMGEIEVVLNGAHFRTRHNDYQVVKPSTTTSDYHAREPIEFPPVPPEVLNETDLTVAARTLRSYFRAWQNGDDSQLNYRPYFKPVLCYLEGAWTSDRNLDEPFDSERHHLDASSWYDLQEKVRFTSYTGDKDTAENYAFLPTAIYNITDGQPAMAQWNYRILCHPVEDDLLEVKDFRPVDDVSNRVAYGKTLEEWLGTRKARFRINERDGDHALYSGDTLLDRIMSQIPGKDNYGAEITDNNLGNVKFDIHDNEKPLNGGYYHRWVFVQNKDAMGVRTNRRGFADRNMWVAQNTQPRVVPLELNSCDRAGNNCVYSSARVSFAIPMEIVWLTPLNSWNPYELKDWGPHRTELGQSVTAGGRNGGLTADKAFNGTNTKHHFLTPIQFFKGGEFETDAADTTPGAVGVLDPWGNVRQMTSSGIRIFLPEMTDVGNVRIRYPIFPVFAEGNTAFKEVEALAKVVMDMTANARYLHEEPQFGSNETEDIPPNKDLMWYRLQTAPSVSSTGGSHIHYLDMKSQHAIYAMDGCETYQVRTSLSKYHTHLLTVHYNSTSQQFEYLACDGQPTCRDNHGIELTPVRT